MNTKRESLVVVGLGYVGLPLAYEAAVSGLGVTGLDLNRHVVDSLNNGRSHVDDISNQQVESMRRAGFSATTEPGCLSEADVIVICVPTPLDEHLAPDMRAIEAAGRSIRDQLRRGQLVVLESTTYPGTTDGLLREILEGSGLKAGIDFALAFSPERIDPGNETWTLRNTPKIVGGYTTACGDRAEEFYAKVVDRVVRTTGTREAEMAKLLENTYRHVNIALVNEMAIFSRELGVDLWSAIDAASTKPFGFAAFYPGPGVGGHCIPIDPNYLSHRVRALGYQFRFVELAQEISGRMPSYVVSRIQEQLNRACKAVNGSRVLLLGLTYKRDIADDRETPAREVIRGLRRSGAIVIGDDPKLSSFEVDGETISMSSDLTAELSHCDIAVLLQRHSTYDLDQIGRLAPLVLDTRGCMTGPNVERL